MVGHTSVYDTAIKAVTATDKALGTIYDTCEKAGYVLMITADHGNAEQTINLETGASHEQGSFYLDRKSPRVRHG